MESRDADIAFLLRNAGLPWTWEDVEVLEDAIYQIHGPKMDALRPGIEQGLDSIKERITALLPPRA